MASSKDYLDFVLEQLSEMDEIAYRAMMRNTSYIIEAKCLAESMTTVLSLNLSGQLWR